MVYNRRMSAIGRFLWASATARTRPKMALLDESRLELMVLPADLDTFGHMNNGRYLTLMDLGRTDLLSRTGILKTAGKRGWAPLVGGATIGYHKPLHLFQTYVQATRIVGWDAKWLFFQQRFLRGEELIAHAVVKGLFRTEYGNVPSSEVVREAGEGTQSPPLPEVVVQWAAGDKAFRELAGPSTPSASGRGA